MGEAWQTLPIPRQAGGRPPLSGRGHDGVAEPSEALVQSSPCWLRYLVRVENGSLTCSVLPSSVEETSRHGTIWLGFLSTVERRSMRR